MTAPSDRPADRHATEPPPLGATAEAALAALFDAAPEAAEHLIKAGRELLLAAQAVVGAGERAVESHRSPAGAAGASAGAGEAGARRRGRRHRFRRCTPGG